MEIIIERRAEIAFRSLDKNEQKKITHSLSAISNIDRKELVLEPKLHKLATGFSDKKLYSYRGSPKYRLILSFEEEFCIVEDIVDHDRLNRLFVKKGEA